MVQLKMDSAVCYRLLNCNYSPNFEDFSILCYNNKKYNLIKTYKTTIEKC